MADVVSSGSARTHLTIIDLAEALDRAATADPPAHPIVFRWVWIVLVGVVAVAGGAGFAYCKSHGYDGFTGDISVARDANGVQIGVKIGCY